jgi:ELWxxDGT repeat protein
MRCRFVCPFLVAGLWGVPSGAQVVGPAPALIADITPGGSTVFSNAVTYKGARYFLADTGSSGWDLWRTDGTPAGTLRVKDIGTGPVAGRAFEIVVAGGILFFVADEGTHGWELWRSDGTAGGTAMVKDICPPGGAGPYLLTPVGATLFFAANDGAHGAELWKSDGTAAGTVLVEDILPGSPSALAVYPEFTASGDLLYFVTADTVHGRELWKSDGSEEGTKLLADIKPGAEGGYPALLVDVAGTLFFAADDGVHGWELWKSNGTAAATVLVKDINPGPGWSMPDSRSYLEAIGNTLFFTGSDGVSGYELWRSDGTAGGTVLVKDLNPGSGDSVPGDLTNVGGRLWFTANHHREVWRSDGTLAGTALVSAGEYVSAPSFTGLGASVYFAADDGVHGTEVWRTDGTAGGTRLVADLWPGRDSAGPSGLTTLDGVLLFEADDGSYGRELYRVGPAALNPLEGPLVVGTVNTVTGAGFTPGSRLMLYVATAAGAVSHGPYEAMGRNDRLFEWFIPPEVPLGNGFASVQVVNTDEGYTESNVVWGLLEGNAAAGIPTILFVNGEPLAPPDPGIALAHVDTIVAPGGVVSLIGTGFNRPVVNLFTADGKFDLEPASWSPTQFDVVVPAAAPSGPGNLQVVNRVGWMVSNAVSAVIGARPTITSVSVCHTTVTVTGTGFSRLSVINLFEQQVGGVVNLGGFGPDGPRIPLAVFSDTLLTFRMPDGAVGQAFVEVLNPPFIPFSSSGNDPDGAFALSPIAVVLDGPDEVVVGTPADFRVTVTPAGTPVTGYRFNFGEGTEVSVVTSATTFVQLHTFRTLGAKTVTVTAFTAFGGTFSAQHLVNVVLTP